MKFFVASDIHGFYTQFKEALDEKGFDINNSEHYLIICGDLLDRGNEPKELLNYLKTVERKILVRGNHEDLFEELCDRQYPERHDYHNGTEASIESLAYPETNVHKIYKKAHKVFKPFLDSMVNYFETEHYIFVHSWIPTLSKQKEDATDLEIIYGLGFYDVYDENWRDANDTSWSIARWGKPFKLAKNGLNQTGKTIIFGHWHCSTGWADGDREKEFGENANFEPFYGDNYIGIDGCTAHTKKVNIIVIEDEFLKPGD